jgi:hypothetical protein
VSVLIGRRIVKVERTLSPLTRREYRSSLCGSDWSAARVVGFEDGKVAVGLPDGSTARRWPEQVRA